MRPLACSFAAIALALACGEQPADPPAPAPAPTDTSDPVYEDPSFAPLGPPPPAGWRTRVDERGQSFADYQASEPNRPTPTRQTLVLQPIAPFPHRVVLADDLPSITVEEAGFVTFVFAPAPQQLAEFLAGFYGLPTRVAPERTLDSLALAPIRAHHNHAQYDAQALLAALAPALPDDAYSLTALFARDLVVEQQQEFAFGYGLHRDRLAVLSFAQLDPQWAGAPRPPDIRALIERRSYKLLAHEVGHTLGFGHCDEYACVMNGVAHLDELDATPLRLCPICLRKLIWLTGVEPLARYRELAAHYQANELLDELAWVRARIDRLSPSSSAASPRAAP